MTDCYTVYIISNRNHTVFYTGVTHDIAKRIIEHQTKAFPSGFTAQYNCHKLLYFEYWEDRDAAYHREKQIKRYKRDWKINLINSLNPFWRDLNDDLIY